MIYRILNKKKNETFKQQQVKGLRPRFSIINKIIKPYNLKPIFIGDIDNLENDFGCLAK